MSRNASREAKAEAKRYRRKLSPDALQKELGQRSVKMGDRRTKRLRTRSNSKREAIRLAY